MKTLTLPEAAYFLKMHYETVRERAKAGIIHGAKPGRAWVFIEDDLADYLRSLYSRPRQALRVTLRKELFECHSVNAGQSGGSTYELQTESEYDELLGLTTKPWRKNSTTG